jgi:hypothetical protein
MLRNFSIGNFWRNEKASRVPIFLHLVAGGVIVLVSAFSDHILAQNRNWGSLQSISVTIGAGIIVLGFYPFRSEKLSQLSSNLCLSVLSLFTIIAISEGMIRLIDFDFSAEERAWQNTPVYYRKPTIPSGEVYYKRSGPEQWTGQVLNTIVTQLDIQPNPYIDEPVITVKYDRNGFRNPENLSDWKIAIAGDSFTELGYLPDEHLFTSILANSLGVSVANLGTSYTGPLTHLHYLKDFGVAPSTEHVVIVFFEGNDLLDLDYEYKALLHWRETGERPRREFKKQTSLVKALYQLQSKIRHKSVRQNQSNHTTAYFDSLDGEIPVSLIYDPPGEIEISNETFQQLNYFFKEYSAFGRKNRPIRIWLAYMPSKRRVFHDHLVFSDHASEQTKSWQPTNLPQVISKLCAQYGVRFIDLTPGLVRETDDKKRLLYNSIYDTHLNAGGSEVVSRQLLEHLSVHGS